MVDFTKEIQRRRICLIASHFQMPHSSQCHQLPTSTSPTTPTTSIFSKETFSENAPCLWNFFKYCTKVFLARGTSTNSMQFNNSPYFITLFTQ